MKHILLYSNYISCIYICHLLFVIIYDTYIIYYPNKIITNNVYRKYINYNNIMFLYFINYRNL